MSISCLRGDCLALMLCALSGCADLGRSYSEIDPEGAAADIRKNSGYFALRSVTPGTAKIVMRSEGSGSTVNFSVSTSGVACEDFKSVGRTRFTGRGIIYPWIADFSQSMSGTKGFLESEVVPGRSVYIRSSSSWAESNSVPGSGITTASSGRCGPLISKFDPEKNHAYLVRFVWNEWGCTQYISDATNPDAPVLIPAEEVFNCTKP